MDEEPDMGALATYHFGHLPVWLSGNAYFNAATVCKHEKNCLIDKDAKVEVKLVEENGTYRLETNVFDYLKDFRTGIINSDILGCAFEPEQRFENPDGSEIIFDRDYFGGHRGTSAIPGPFATAEDAGKLL